MSANDADNEVSRQPLSRANGLVLVMNTPKGGYYIQAELHMLAGIAIPSIKNLAAIFNGGCFRFRTLDLTLPTALSTGWKI